MICPNCENKIPDKAKVCGYCGHRLKAGAPVQGTISQPVSSQRGMPVWAWGLIGGLVVFLGIAIFTVANLRRENAQEPPPPTTLPPAIIPTQVPSLTPLSPTNTQETDTQTQYQSVFTLEDDDWINWSAGKIIEPYLLLMTSDGEMYIFDLESLDQGGHAIINTSQAVNELNFGDYQGMIATKGYLYLFGRHGLMTLDVGDPLRPRILNQEKTGWISNMTSAGNLLIGVGHGSIYFYSLNNPTSPKLIEVYSADDEKEYFWSVAVSQNVLYTGSWWEDNNPERDMLGIFDITDPNSPIEIGSQWIEETPYHLIVKNDLLIACGDLPITLWDISDPRHPEKLDKTYDYSGRLCFFDDNRILLGYGNALRLTGQSLDYFAIPDVDTGSGSPFFGDASENWAVLPGDGKAEIMRRLP